MSKQRYISTSFWSDDWVDSLSIHEKLLYMYLLTNECTNIAGIYKITIKRIKDDTGIPREDIISILEKFASDKKALYHKEFIIIPKWLKHQKLSEKSGKLIAGVKSILKSLPDDIKEFIAKEGNYEYDLLPLFKDSKDIGYGKKPIDYPEKGIPYPQNTDKADRLSQNDGISADDLDLDSDKDIDLDVDLDPNPEKQSGAQPVENSDTNSTTTILFIQNKAKEKDFFISSKQAEQFLTLPLDWLEGDFSFIEFAAMKIRENTDKSQSDQERLFVKSWSYQNLKDEFPDWREKKIIAAKEKKRKKEIENARENNKPKLCQCGGAEFRTDGESYLCLKCGGLYRFDIQKMKYVFSG